MEFHFQYLYLSALLFVAVVFFFVRRLRIERMITKRERIIRKSNPAVNQGYRFREWFRLSLYTLALILLVLSIMRPVGNPQNVPTVTVNRDMLILLDVSRSMLARDVIPSRLEKAKEIIRDLTSALSGERVGLLIFAGNTSIVSPLTSDYYFFLKSVDGITTDRVSKGGSEIGTAIDYTIKTFFKDTEKNKKSDRHILLITDGDNLESKPLDSAALAAKDNIVIHTISVGTKEGGKIPLDNSSSGYLQYDGEDVITRPDEDMLRKIASTTDGIFIPAGSAKVSLGEIYKAHLAFQATDTDEKGNSAKIWTEYYRYFLFMALLLILLEKPIILLINRKLAANK